MRLTGLVVACALSAGVTSADTTPAGQRRLAPDFTLQSVKGERISLSSYRGRVVLLDFWATWCTGCKVEIPWFVEFDRKYKTKGLITIGSAMDEEGEKLVVPYLTEHAISYPIVPGYPSLVKPYEITSLPVTLLIDKRGRIADAHAGIVDKEIWEREIQSLLREPRK
ncbi:MAG TPA: TlpA disulfide reductase family protein [Vicinamibacterales bacterium]|jgi:cytochrome c biogenesis protein CcmG/thiol:disulfide interchange protein DsbE